MNSSPSLKCNIQAQPADAAVKCLFCWYWVSDFCVDHDIVFTLGHALYMKAVHGGKTKNDRIDSQAPPRSYRCIDPTSRLMG